MTELSGQRYVLPTRVAHDTLDVSAALERCAQVESQIRAWAHLTESAALPPSPIGKHKLAGRAFGVKDVIDVAGMPTRSGSSATASDPAQCDATCVLLLREAGAVPIGKTVTAEFAYSSPGPTRNPHNVGHTPGGSSSGSAAAVAAGMVSFALGTQTGGSMIRPAAFCGVVGFKPTFGRVHRHGMDVLCDSLDTIGWFSQDVAQSIDVASVLLPASGDELVRPTSFRPATPRVAVLDCRAIAQLSVDAGAAFDKCVTQLTEHGAVVVRPTVDNDLQALLDIHTQVMHAELARALLPRLRTQGEHLSPALRTVIERGLEISYSEYVRLQAARNRLSMTWRTRFETTDIIMAPSASGTAPEGLASTGSSTLNRVWSLLGWPCMHLPTATSAEGLPMGVQWIAQPDMDHALLQWAGTLHPRIDGRRTCEA